MNLGNVCRSITDGDHQAPPKTEIGIPFITISDVNDGRLKLDRATRFVSHDYFENLKPTRKPQQGDVLFTVTGSIAIPVLVNTNAPFTFQRHIAILKPDRIKVYSNYLAYALSSNNVKSQANSVASGIAQLTIPLAKLHAIEISVPSLEEQDEVVRRVEALFSYAEQVESRCQVALAHVEQLTQALLAKAFRGELVPQDPNDEPASVLLERARTLRELQPIKPKRVLPRKPNMIKITEASVKKAVRQLPSDTFSFDELRESIPGDYETLKEVVFALLEEPEPGFTQIFDQEVQAIRFVQRHT
jgi:type I restriction enzyme S subunit